MEPQEPKDLDEQTNMPDSHVRWIDHAGERILRIDLSGCSGTSLERRLRTAAQIIRASPPRSVLALNLVQGVPLDRETASIVKDYVRGNKPHVLAAAVVGLGYMSAVIPVLNRLTGRSLASFDDESSALAWLVERGTRSRDG